MLLSKERLYNCWFYLISTLKDITLLALETRLKSRLAKGEEADSNELAASFFVYNTGSVLYKDFH